MVAEPLPVRYCRIAARNGDDPEFDKLYDRASRYLADRDGIHVGFCWSTMADLGPGARRYERSHGSEPFDWEERVAFFRALQDEAGSLAAVLVVYPEDIESRVLIVRDRENPKNWVGMISTEVSRPRAFAGDSGKRHALLLPYDEVVEVPLATIRKADLERV